MGIAPAARRAQNGSRRARGWCVPRDQTATSSGRRGATRREVRDPACSATHGERQAAVAEGEHDRKGDVGSEALGVGDRHGEQAAGRVVDAQDVGPGAQAHPQPVACAQLARRRRRQLTNRDGEAVPRVTLGEAGLKGEARADGHVEGEAEGGGERPALDRRRLAVERRRMEEEGAALVGNGVCQDEGAVANPSIAVEGRRARRGGAPIEGVHEVGAHPGEVAARRHACHRRVVQQGGTHARRPDPASEQLGIVRGRRCCQPITTARLVAAAAGRRLSTRCLSGSRLRAAPATVPAAAKPSP